MRRPRGGWLKGEKALGGLPASRVAEALRGFASRHDPYDVRLYAALISLPGADSIESSES